MPRPARFSVVALLALAAGPATRPTTEPANVSPVAEPVGALVRRLGDPDPAARRAAGEKLVALGSKATPALRAAARGPRPAVAEAAAELLLKGNWWAHGDPAWVRLKFAGYGTLAPADRAAVIRDVIDRRLTDFRPIALRVLLRDPADEVAWQSLDNLPADAEWETLLTAAGPDTLPPALKLLLARAKDQRGDAAGALELVRRVLDEERDRPTSSGQWLGWAVRTLVTADTRAGRYAGAADRLRELLARADDAPTDGVALLDQLLDLHVRHGPLPGFAADLKLADADPESHGPFAVALAADRVAGSFVGGLLLDAALRPRPDENDTDRAARLGDTADALQRAGHLDAACRAFDQITRVDNPMARGRVILAYVRLSILHAAASRPALAGDALQRAMERQESPVSINRELWPLEDEQAKIHWYYLLDAHARGDADRVAKQADLILASGSTDSGQFLDVLPHLAGRAPKEAVDAYFDRVFDRCRARIDESPDEAVHYNDIAWLCARSGRKLPEAVAWAERAVTAQPEEAAFLDTLAEAKFRTGKISEAIELEKKALANGPDDEDFMRQQLERFQKAAATQPGD